MGKRVSERGVAAHSLAQFDDARFLGSQIYEIEVGQNRQHPELVGESPIQTICADIGGEARRVNEGQTPNPEYP